MFKTYIKNKALASQGGSSLIKDNNPNGYFLKDELVKMIDQLSADSKTHYKVRNLEFLFDAMKQNVSLTKEPQHVVKDGIESTWLTMKLGRVVKVLNIEHFGDIKRLIDDYAMGVIKVTQTLVELYDEASL